MASAMRFLYSTFQVFVVVVVILAEWACSQQRAEQTTTDTNTVQVAAAIAPVAQPTPKQLADSLVQSIDRQLKTLNATKEIDVTEESLEGGTVVGYWAGKSLRKADCWLYGETGKMHVEGYYDADSVRFVRVSRYVYDKPFYEEGFKVVQQVAWKHYLAGISTKATPPDELMIFQSDQNTPPEFWVRKMRKLKALIIK
jgi:hypothetical protein